MKILQSKICIHSQNNVSKQYIIFVLFLSFMLYPVYQGCMKESGNLVLRHSVHHSWVLKAFRVEWRNSTPGFASTLELRNRNIHLNNYFICSSGDRTHNQSRLQSHFVPLRHVWPLLWGTECLNPRFLCLPCCVRDTA